MKTAKTIVIFYHSPCIDGAASAWVARRALQEKENVVLDFVPLSYGKPEERTQTILDHLRDGADAFFFDTAPKDDTLRILMAPTGQTPRIDSLTVVDHHISETTRLRKFEQTLITHPSPTAPRLSFVLDETKQAAALLAWEHFHPKEQAPDLLEWVGLMEPPVRLHSSRDFAIAAFIDSQDISTPETAFDTMDLLLSLSEDTMVMRGNAILADQFNNINKSIKTSLLYAKLELLKGKTEWIPLVNANVQNFGRRINAAMIEEACAGTTCGVSGAWFVQNDGTVKLSLRSKGTPDVGKIAQYLGETLGIGGGGHATDAVVQFETLVSFTQNVPLRTKEQMLVERWKPEP